MRQFLVLIFVLASSLAQASPAQEDLAGLVLESDPILHDLYVWAAVGASNQQYSCYKSCVNADPNQLESSCEEPSSIAASCSSNAFTEEALHKNCVAKCGL